jgi:hypothetical protein
MTLKDFMEVTGYRITEGSDYGWECYGPNSYMIDSWNGDQDGYSFSIIFDTKTQVVYEMQAHDYSNNRAYRVLNAATTKKMKKEAKRRSIDKDEAWDGVDYVDLEVVEDFLEKARAIVAGEEYDTRVQVPLTLPDDQLFELMKMAHERDITLNALVEDVLRTQLNLLEVTE